MQNTDDDCKNHPGTVKKTLRLQTFQYYKRGLTINCFLSYVVQHQIHSKADIQNESFHRPFLVSNS